MTHAIALAFQNTDPANPATPRVLKAQAMGRREDFVAGFTAACNTVAPTPSDAGQAWQDYRAATTTFRRCEVCGYQPTTADDDNPVRYADPVAGLPTRALYRYACRRCRGGLT